MQEIWKDVVGYEGLYKVSNLGNIQSLYHNCNNKSHKLLKYISIHGYYRITLTKNKKQKKFFVHRLVAQAFICNPNNYPQVNHIDGNKLNNSVSNLEWCTQSHNMKEAYRIGLEKPKRMTINQYDLSGNFIKVWNSIKDIEVFYNNRHISDCCKDKRKTACGYIWRYADK